MGGQSAGAVMLRQRVITALVMAGAFLTAILTLPLVALAAVFGVVVCLGAWEWSRMAGWQSPVARGLYVLALAVCLGALFVYTDLGGTPTREKVQPLLGLACLWWSFALLWVKGYPASAVLWRSEFMRSLMGVLILALGWMAAVYVLSFPQGPVLMVVMVVVVAAADVGAYFSGKAFGRHKLAVHVSPNKTWEGFWGGLLTCIGLATLLWSQLPARMEHILIGSVVAVAVATALASVVGDLTVSMVKRESGVKDSGSLLPGHGGVLDRLDSLCGAAPIFALGLLLAGW
jgi:phosphatidate cytidylyltransferase